MTERERGGVTHENLNFSDYCFETSMICQLDATFLMGRFS